MGDTDRVNTTNTKPLLSQSWNTLLRGGMHPNGSNQSLLVVPDTDPLDDSIVSTQSSAPKKSREKSKILDMENEQNEEHEIEMSKSVSGTISGDHGSKRQHDVVSPQLTGHAVNGQSQSRGYHHNYMHPVRPGPAISISTNGRKSSTPLPYQANYTVHSRKAGIPGLSGIGGHGVHRGHGGCHHISESMSQKTMTT